MSETTYDVRVSKLRKYTGKRGTTYTVRWTAAGKERRDTFATKALADSFRAELLSAQSQGEAFVVETGLPVSKTRAVNELSWFEFACAYVDMKWPDLSGNSRRVWRRR